jgi:N-acetylglucosaminyldiphosphoundecaprenol N-acetyl-beta-D-mannosaminyltransferase
MGDNLVSVTSRLLPPSRAAVVDSSRSRESVKGAAPAQTGDAANGHPGLPDDLAREVYCILGMPVDAIDVESALHRIETAAEQGAPYLISTPNLNFLINSLSNPEFRKSLMTSDLCTADGMPIVWIARLLGLPFKDRVAGSALFDALSKRKAPRKPLRVFMFGGPPGVAKAAGELLNERSETLTCVGSLYPGHGSVEELSDSQIIDAINESEADFLVAALGAAKGQSWLLHNRDRLKVPVRSHLGAVINFQAGTVQRAPASMQKAGFEWLWRIKEEPHLWRRYWTDAKALVRLTITRVLPLAVNARLSRYRYSGERHKLRIRMAQTHNSTVLHLSGRASKDDIDAAVGQFRKALDRVPNALTIDLAGVTTIDPRFLGLLLMLRKAAEERDLTFKLGGATRRVRRILRLNAIGYTISPVEENRPDTIFQPAELPGRSAVQG